VSSVANAYEFEYSNCPIVVDPYGLKGEVIDVPRDIRGNVGKDKDLSVTRRVIYV